MRLVRFTQNFGNNPPVFINPDQVVAVYAEHGATYITLSVPQSFDGARQTATQYSVMEPIEEVVAALSD